MAAYRGIHHLAMATRNMDETIKFWRDILGMRLILGLGKPGYRHYFFEISSNDTIAFFEWPQVEPIEEKDHGFPVKGPFVFDHVSIGVTEKEKLWEIKQILEKAGYWVSEVIDHGFILSVYSFDPNGIAIEFSWEVEELNPHLNPKLLDTDPPPIALEGPEPRGERRPNFLPCGEHLAYPGERDQFETRKNHWGVKKIS
ncbi:MAG: VOC family protein [Syntrophobacterales bacterium]|nr:VOC family protein [Syntrophobacterales bacterium]